MEGKVEIEEAPYQLYVYGTFVMTDDAVKTGEDDRFIFYERIVDGIRYKYNFVKPK